MIPADTTTGGQSSTMNNIAAGAGIIGAGISIGKQIFGKTTDQKDKEQIAQQGRLQGLQISGEKELADYQRQLQMETWHDTNAAAQVEEYKKAGLSPGLMYQQSGAGGQLGSGMAAMPTGATASDEASRSNAETNQNGMGLQAAMAMSQLALMNAQTEKTTAEADKIKGADTQKTQQDTATSKSSQALIDLQSKSQQTLNFYQSGKEQAGLDKLQSDAAEADSKAQQAFYNKEITAQTYKDQITQIKQEAINTAIQGNALAQGIQVDKSKVQEIAASINQKWQEISTQQVKNAYEHSDRLKAIEEFTTNALKVAGIHAVGNVVSDVVKIATKTQSTTTTSSKYDSEGNLMQENYETITHK